MKGVGEGGAERTHVTGGVSVHPPDRSIRAEASAVIHSPSLIAADGSGAEYLESCVCLTGVWVSVEESEESNRGSCAFENTMVNVNIACVQT